ncbi:MAG: ribonuclease P protein component [Anaerolineae bacterium]
MQRRLRLRRNEDFQRLRSEGRKVAHPLLVMVVAPNQCAHNRYGVIASRRLGNAVARNRAKRRIREAIRHWHPHIPPGHDLLFIARHPVLTCAYPALVDAIGILLRRANLV